MSLEALFLEISPQKSLFFFQCHMKNITHNTLTVPFLLGALNKTNIKSHKSISEKGEPSS